MLNIYSDNNIISRAQMGSESITSRLVNFVLNLPNGQNNEVFWEIWVTEEL